MAIELLIDSAHGVFVAQIFARSYDAEQWNIDPDDMMLLADIDSAPQDGSYWDIWDSVLNNAKYTDNKGNEWMLWQDGDLWAYCLELMTDEDYYNLFGEDRNDHF